MTIKQQSGLNRTPAGAAAGAAVTGAGSAPGSGNAWAPPAKSRVRDRIFETACELFYRHGIRGVGVDAIAAEAGSNKMSFYRSFASKDALVTEYLRQQEQDYWVWWENAVSRFPADPRRQIEALFEAQLEFAETAGCRGCALGNAAVEISEREDTLATLVREYKTKVRVRLHDMSRALGARDAEALGDALMLLMDGGHFTRLVFPRASGPISSALPAVRALIAAYSGPNPA